MKTVVQERRKFSRTEPARTLAINLLQPRGSIIPQSINVSEGGLCLRLEEALEVRSLIRLQLCPGGANSFKGERAVECTGRVAWVIQRQDLRSGPPFVFDVGIEFVDPPRVLRRFIAQQGHGLVTLKGRPVQEKALEPALLRGRLFVPTLRREANRASPWHLIVSVDGTPCFSGHYASERAATAAWATFRHQQTKR